MNLNKIPLALSERQIQIVGNALGLRPYAEVAALIADIHQQVEAHNKTLLVQCRDSGQMSTAQEHQHKQSGAL